MYVLHLYDENVMPIVCPRCDGEQYIDDVALGSSPNHPLYHTYTCVNCHEKVNLDVYKFVRMSRPRVILQPVCSICETTLVEKEGDLCPGCEAFAHVHDRTVSRDQAALGRFY